MWYQVIQPAVMSYRIDVINVICDIFLVYVATRCQLQLCMFLFPCLHRDLTGRAVVEQDWTFPQPPGNLPVLLVALLQAQPRRTRRAGQHDWGVPRGKPAGGFRDEDSVREGPTRQANLRDPSALD
jgi:hypothetical protein